MEAILIFFILILLVSYILKDRKYKNQSEQIKYITNKINDIIKNETSEKILVFTEIKEIQDITSSINNLLNYSDSNKIAYENSKLSMMRMISNMSHDLKTPLTTLKGYVEMLKIKFNADNMVINIDSRINEILELINNFFDLAKLESGDKILRTNKINLCEICRKNMFVFYNTIQKEGIDVNINIPEEPIYYNGDEEAMNRVLKNLIDNAIKYGGGGKYLGIVVGKNSDNVYIEIEDHGKGILEKDKEKVFERLYTLEDSRSKQYQGSGLGLTITKELIEKMNGKINLYSIPNEVTVFKIILPKAK